MDSDLRRKRQLRAPQPERPRARFRREAPEERRRQLGEAALRCILRNGNAGVSLRQVAAEAGVTQGLITHHFGEINELVAYAFDIMSEGLMSQIMQAVEAAGERPRDRLNAFIDVSFSPMLFDKDVLGVWVVFWGLILHSPRMSAAQKNEYSGYLSTVGTLIADVAREEGFEIGDEKLTAISFTAIMDGLWLAWCLNPNSFAPEDGIRICHGWIDGLRRGVKL